MSCFSCENKPLNKSMIADKYTLKDIMLAPTVQNVKDNIIQNTKKNMNNRVSIIQDFEERDIPIPFCNEKCLKMNNELIKRLK